MASDPSIDLIPLDNLLESLAASIREANLDQSWLTVETTSRELANSLRVRGGPVDNHTVLGKGKLPQSLSTLLSLALGGTHIPSDNRTSAIYELLRVGANLCMDHDDNRTTLLEIGFPQAVMSLLEGYAETIPVPPDANPLPLSIPHLKVVRTAIGVLLNASIGFNPVKIRLISLEAALTIIKLSSSIYPPTSWTVYHGSATEALFSEEWNLRTGISSWAWRTISSLKDNQDESLQIINYDVLPWITPPLLKFCPPQTPKSHHLVDADPDLLDSLLQADFDYLEEACTLIESLSLDFEEFRLELARTNCYPDSSNAVPCISTILDFIEYGSYPPLWNSSVFDEDERKSKEKAFDICKAALIKAVVEVFGEEKNDEILWNDGDSESPGGAYVKRMVSWIKRYADNVDIGSPIAGNYRDDMAICASLCLGNLATKATTAAALLSPPHTLAPVLSSDRFFSPETDIKLKHGILGLLKHLAQFSRLSPVIPASLSQVDILGRIAASGVWDEKSDAMADVIQLSAIGVAKHLCNASLDHTFALALPGESNRPTGLSQILALIKRSDSVSIKSEGARVLVNVVKSLWLNDRGALSQVPDRQRKKDACLTSVLTPECALTLTNLIGRSGRYPSLVNEGIVAISLLCTHKLGGAPVIEALTTPLNGASTIEEVSPATANNDASNSLPTPSTSSRNEGLLIPGRALDMLVSVLRNVDNPVNFPIEVRVNTCTFFLQLQRHTLNESLARIRETILPVVQQVAEDSQDAEGEERLAKAANSLLESLRRAQPAV
ncbi:hypothetical protein B0H34DRAFT_694710 [Crassisporium funariophilum]|nr:hypothetical protein B0H34DRAFT_694710 [Crassisporium funariophilum]